MSSFAFSFSLSFPFSPLSSILTHSLSLSHSLSPTLSLSLLTLSVSLHPFSLSPCLLCSLSLTNVFLPLFPSLLSFSPLGISPPTSLPLSLSLLRHIFQTLLFSLSLILPFFPFLSLLSFTLSLSHSPVFSLCPLFSLSLSPLFHSLSLSLLLHVFVIHVLFNANGPRAKKLGHFLFLFFSSIFRKNPKTLSNFSLIDQLKDKLWIETFIQRRDRILLKKKPTLLFQLVSIISCLWCQ